MQGWDDSDLKALFLEMRDRDRETATRFETDWQLAKSSMPAARRASFRYVVAAVSVVALALSTAIVLRHVRQPSLEHQQAEAEGRQELTGGIRDLADRYPSASMNVPTAPPAERAVPGIVSSHHPAIKRLHPSRRPRPGNDTGNDQGQQLISTWRSPTDFLLKSLAGDLLRAVPDIRYSLVTIDGK
jgi:hypothetical protein